MKQKKNKFSSITNVLRTSFTITVAAMFVTSLSIAQSNKKSGNDTYEIYSEKLPKGAELQNSENYIREIGLNGEMIYRLECVLIMMLQKLLKIE